MAGRNILIAEVRAAHKILAACLPGDHLRCVESLAEAKTALLANDFDMVVVGVRFDESRTFWLLNYLRSYERYKGVPVVCVRVLPCALPRAIRASVGEALKAIGVVDLLEIDGTDHETVCRRLREIADHRRSVP